MNGQAIKFSKEAGEFITSHGTSVTTLEGNTYYYLPYWFQATEQEGVFKQFDLDQMPDDFNRATGKD